MHPCTVCERPTYIGDVHPCCAYWAELEPETPCMSCNASRGFWATRPKKKRGKN